MSLELPLWSIPIGTAVITSLYFIPSHMNYSLQEWIIGNGLIGLGVGLFYIVGGIKK